ncbi:MAG: LLM class flavin-dependent oxidoreductase [Burkholderiaceae bacterium]
MIKPWLFTFLKPLGRRRSVIDEQAASQETYDFHLSILPSLERMGFEGVFFSEHHFFGNISPSPNLMIAAASQRTERLRLGVMGNVLPMNIPYRVAEEIGMLNLLTRQRLDIGYSSGAGPMEPVVAGIRKEEIRPRYEEALEIIELALHHGSVDFRGDFYFYDKLAISPRLSSANLPPRWITVLSAPSAEAAAQRGCRICTGFLSTEAIVPIFAAYKQAARRSSKPFGSSQMGIRRQILVWDSDAEANRLGAELKRIQIEELDGRAQSIVRRHDSARSTEPSVSAIPDFPSAAGLFSEADECIFGSPATVTERIIEQCRRTGAGHMMAYMFSGLDAEETRHSLSLWQRVIPELRRAGVVDSNPLG